MQRDFGIYVINMFDTGQASRQLKKESFSYAYLLSFYCKIIANKAYQKADWRVRPLSKGNNSNKKYNKIKLKKLRND